ncbi:MAG TPA: DNA polymerase III subunit gamma/tau [Phycisphaerae bacterium]|nr:DNA polymerase III subunit gamma/tau [Phycisphaerae bacterium]
MSYTVLARKFRSQTFEEVVGQDAITATLKNAIGQNRVHHGYLFCGTRGVGKTSMARILAKALNCLSSDGPTVTPCGKCDSCEAVARGEDVDVVEIDAASNTGVDNIRELRNNAVYRPARSRFKIYIIDEVHMLSKGAFNALLKTLEEPPSHVKFIFATTEPEKVPPTILSRVQRFDFKTIPPEDIARQLLMICREEGVEAEEPGIKRLARLANGSMRDALSLLDQVMSMAGTKITTDIVNELFPAAHDELFAQLIDRLAAGDAAGALAVADRSLSQGQSLDHWCSLLIGQIRDLMMLRVCGEETDLVDVPAGLRTQLVEQAKQFDAGSYVYMITVLEELRRSVKYSGSGRALTEAAMVRLAEAPNFSSIESLLAQVKGGDAGTTSARAAAQRPASPLVAAPRRTASPPASMPTGTAVTPAPAGPPGAAGKPKAAPRTGTAKETRRGRQPRAEASSEAVASPGRRMTQADLKAAQADPTVQSALNIFGGNIVHVRRDEPSVKVPGEPKQEPD